MNKLLILHHTAVSREKQKAQFYSTGRFHKQKWGMKSKLGYYHGYTHFMGTNGVITQTRSLDEEGMHTIGYNKDGHIALCLAGNFTVELPTEAQIASLKVFINKHSDYTIKFHGELNNRICAGKLLTREWLNDILYGNAEFDEEDKIKEQQILRLSSLLDTLMELYQQLLNKLKKHE